MLRPYRSTDNDSTHFLNIHRAAAIDDETEQTLSIVEMCRVIEEQAARISDLEANHVCSPRIAELEADLDIAETALTKLHKVNNELEADLEDASINYNNVASGYQELEAKLADRTERAAALDSRCIEFNEQIVAHKGRIAGLEAEVERLNGNTAYLMGQLDKIGRSGFGIATYDADPIMSLQYAWEAKDKQIAELEAEIAYFFVGADIFVVKRDGTADSFTMVTNEMPILSDQGGFIGGMAGGACPAPEPRTIEQRLVDVYRELLALRDAIGWDLDMKTDAYQVATGPIRFAADTLAPVVAPILARGAGAAH